MVALRTPNFAVQNCDLLIAIGVRFDNSVTAFNPARFGRAARKVVVDVDPVELDKFNSFHRPQILADAKDFLEAVFAKRPELQKKDRSAWLECCNSWKRRYALNDGKPFPENGEISHYHLVSVFSREFPKDQLIVTGGSGLAVKPSGPLSRTKPVSGCSRHLVWGPWDMVCLQ